MVHVAPEHRSLYPCGRGEVLVPGEQVTMQSQNPEFHGAMATVIRLQDKDRGLYALVCGKHRVSKTREHLLPSRKPPHSSPGARITVQRSALHDLDIEPSSCAGVPPPHQGSSIWQGTGTYA